MALYCVTLINPYRLVLVVYLLVEFLHESRDTEDAVYSSREITEFNDSVSFSVDSVPPQAVGY